VTRRRAAAGALFAVLATLLVIGVRRESRARAASRYVPPVFVEPGPGVRAPTTEFLGARVGFATRADVEASARAAGVRCADRGMRTMMNELREKKRDEIRRAEANGHPDTVSGASIVSRRTARDDNPQVRLSCEGVRAERLGDRSRVEGEGRLLYVFDGDSAKLRHVSFQRNLADWERARRDFQEAVDAAREATFRYPDLTVSVSVMNLGGRGYLVRETAEVPWPVRADAPSRPR